jgi:hypothetical protein
MENDCTPKCGDLSAPISASSVIYKGNILTCIGAEIPDTLESIVHKLDQAICDKLKDIGSLTQLANTGGGIELYLGDSNTGKKEIATLRSPDDSVSIVYNSETKEVDIEVDFPQIQSYIFSSDDGSVDITTNEEGNEVDFSINFPDQEFLKLTSNNSSVTITDGLNPNTKNLEVNFPDQEAIELESEDGSIIISEGSTVDKRDLSVNFPSPVTQVNSDVQENNPLSPAFIRNKNSSAVKFNNYVLTPSDNNRVLLLDTTMRNITISIPTTLPSNNYFVGFIQKGTNLASINNSDIKPVGYTNVIEGEGHSAAIEIIEVDGVKTVFLLGSLKEDNSVIGN